MPAEEGAIPDMKLRSMAHLWLPFTQMRGFDAGARTFVRGQGTTLIDARGRRLYDAVSSIWTTIHGHCHPRIVEAVARQAAKLDHATLLGASNPVAEELAERLCSLATMDRAFFASDGASAIEAAVKMAVQYWQHAGQPQRTRFVHLTDAYHGDTAGAMSLSGIALFKSRFGSVTFETRVYRGDGAFEEDVAAVIVEPLVQAAAGMRRVPPGTYDGLRDIEPLVIFDEIASGFGRTGTMFAFEQTGLAPDLLCLGKGITGGALALSATLVRAPVYDAFLGEPGELVQFFHGHSYAGNPIACAAALASLALFGDERTLEQAAAIAARAGTHLAALQTHPLVREVRQTGTMIGIEVRVDGRRIANALYERGHFTRPIGEVVQFVPPLSSTEEEVDAFFDSLNAILSHVMLSLSKHEG
jgi:adenosylmethionine---8-amino-7-oxononanoate aminotransferase